MLIICKGICLENHAKKNQFLNKFIFHCTDQENLTDL